MYFYDEQDGKTFLLTPKDPTIFNGIGFSFMNDFEEMDTSFRQRMEEEERLIRTEVVRADITFSSEADLTSACIVESRFLELCDKYQIALSATPAGVFNAPGGSQRLLIFNASEHYDELNTAMFRLFQQWFVQTLTAVKDQDTTRVPSQEEAAWFGGAWDYHKNSLFRWDDEINSMIESIFEAYELEEV